MRSYIQKKNRIYPFNDSEFRLSKECREYVESSLYFSKVSVFQYHWLVNIELGETNIEFIKCTQLLNVTCITGHIDNH